MLLSSFFSTILNWLSMWQSAEELKDVSAMTFDDGLSHTESKDDVDDAAAAMPVVTESESEWVEVQGVVPAILPPHSSHSAQRPYKLVSYR